jgi:hypothetical protein
MSDNPPVARRASMTIPKFWVGLLFAVVPFVLILLVPTGPEYRIVQRLAPGTREWVDITPPHPMALPAAIIVILGWAYWLYCIYRLHRVILNPTNGAHPVSPDKAVWFHLIPIYNLFWVFRWTNEMANSVNRLGQKMAKGWSGAFLCFALLIVYFGLLPPSGVLGHAIALAIATIVGSNISRHIRLVSVANSSPSNV